MKGTFLILLCSVIFLSRCKEDKPVICTEQFETIPVEIKNAANIPVALDSFKVIRLSDNTDITVKFDPNDFKLMQKSGSYPITNDSYQDQLFNENVEVVFTGIKESKIIVNQKYTISADQCHVKLITGDRNIILN